MSDSQLQIEFFSGLLELEKKLTADCAFQIQRGIQKGFNVRFRVRDSDSFDRLYWRCKCYWLIKNSVLHKPNGVELLLDGIWNSIPNRYKMQN